MPMWMRMETAFATIAKTAQACADTVKKTEAAQAVSAAAQEPVPGLTMGLLPGPIRDITTMPAAVIEAAAATAAMVRAAAAAVITAIAMADNSREI